MPETVMPNGTFRRPQSAVRSELQPHSVHAEQAVLGGLLLDPSAWDKVADILVADDFYRPDHKFIFGAIGELAATKQPCDVVTVVGELERRAQLNLAGGLAYLGSLAGDTPTAANVRAYAEIVAERARKRRLLTLAGTDIPRAIADGMSATEVAQGLMPVLTEFAAPQSGSVSTLVFPTMADINTAVIEPKTPLFQDLLFPGAWLGVGRPKIGKSWLFLQMVLAAAEDDTFLGYPSMIPGAEALAIFAEDDDARIKSRLGALGVANAPTRCHVINQRQFFALAAQYGKQMTFVEFLGAWLRAHPKVKLVIVDTETATRQIWSGEAGSDGSHRIVETDYKQTRAFDALALELRMVIILVNHASKRKGEWVDIHELINRSNTALAGASGSIVLADPPDADPLDPTQKTRILGVRGRDLADDLLLAVHQHPDMPRFVSEGAYQLVQQTKAEQECMTALEGMMRDVEPNAYVTAKDLADALSKSAATIQRAISRMLKEGRTTWKGFRITAKPGKKGGLRLDPR